MSRIMGIDYGEVRVGIALTDPLKIISSGYKTLKNSKTIFTEIVEICKTKEVDTIVIGIPLDQNSAIGSTASKVLKFAKELESNLKKDGLNIPLFEQDERYSTFEALDIMRTMNIKRKNKKMLVDRIAASTILSNFMNSSNKKLLNLTELK